MNNGSFSVVAPTIGDESFINTYDFGFIQSVILTVVSEDIFIEKYNLRKAVVVYSEQAAAELGLEIDHTDEHAANPETANHDFALLIHGIQPAGSEAAAAIRELKRNGVEFAYSR